MKFQIIFVLLLLIGCCYSSLMRLQTKKKSAKGKHFLKSKHHRLKAKKFVTIAKQNEDDGQGQEDGQEEEELDSDEELMEEYQEYNDAADAAQAEIVIAMKQAGETLKDGHDWACVSSDPRTFYSATDKLYEIGSEDFADLNDIARATFVVTQESDVENVLKSLTNTFGKPKEVQDSFRMPHPSGYRDLTAVFESQNIMVGGEDPLKFTITIQLCNIFLVKAPEADINGYVNYLQQYLDLDLPTFEEFCIAANVAPSEFVEMGEELMDTVRNFLQEETLEAIEQNYQGFIFENKYDRAEGQMLLDSLQAVSSSIYNLAYNSYKQDESKKQFRCSILAASDPTTCQTNYESLDQLSERNIQDLFNPPEYESDGESSSDGEDSSSSEDDFSDEDGQESFSSEDDGEESSSSEDDGEESFSSEDDGEESSSSEDDGEESFSSEDDGEESSSSDDDGEEQEL